MAGSNQRGGGQFLDMQRSTLRPAARRRRWPQRSPLAQRQTETLEPRHFLAIDFPALTAVEPLGSLVYRTEVAAAVTVEEPTVVIGFDANNSQAISLLVDPGATLRPSLRVLASDGTTVATQSAASLDETILLPAVVTQPGHYLLEVTGLDASAGDFTARLLVNGTWEADSLLNVAGSPANETLLTAQRVPVQRIADATAYVGTILGTAAVLDSSDFTAAEGFESGVLPAAWQPDATATSGSVRVDSVSAGDGQSALVLEVGDGPADRNEPAPGVAYLYYDPATGEMSLDTSLPLTTLEIVSRSSIFTGDPAQEVADPADVFNVDRDDKIFRLDTAGFGDFSLGNVAQTGLSLDFLNRDLTVAGSILGGGAVAIVVLPMNETINGVTWDLAASFVPQSLTFMHRSSGDAPTAMPDEYRYAASGDGVALSWDGGITWTTVFTPPSADSDWASYTIDLTPFNRAATDVVQVRLQQTAQVGGEVEQQAYDRLQIDGVSLTGGDWYRIDLPAGDYASAVATSDNGTPLRLEMFDQNGIRLAQAADSNDGRSQSISGYRNIDVRPGAVWLRVAGAADAGYALNVVRNGEFGFGLAGRDSLQNSTQVLGHLTANERDIYSVRPGILVTTWTPASQPNFANANRLDPKLYTLDASGTVLLRVTGTADERNENLRMSSAVVKYFPLSTY